jgi:hypothetical protein
MGVAYRAVWLLRCLVFVTAASLAFVTFDGSLFGWHPFSMSLGYIYYMGEGLILAWSFRQQEGMQRVQGIERHAMVQAVAFLLAGLGFATIAYNKVCSIKPPRQSCSAGAAMTVTSGHDRCCRCCMASHTSRPSMERWGLRPLPAAAVHHSSLLSDHTDCSTSRS